MSSLLFAIIRSFYTDPWFKQHEKRVVFSGQFEPKLCGQFKLKKGGQFDPKVVVTLC
jgi:tRNA G46 methylase TrmB